MIICINVVRIIILDQNFSAKYQIIIKFIKVIVIMNRVKFINYSY